PLAHAARGHTFRPIHGGTRMRSLSTSRILKALFALSAVCGLLGSGAAVRAEAGGSSAFDLRPFVCSNRTLSGRYGSKTDGVLLSAAGLTLEFKGLALARFDGRGNLTWIEHVVINGEPTQPGWAEASGTYTVNSDCTGTMVVNSPNSPVPLSLTLVVVNRGREVRTVLDAHAILSVFTRVD